MATREKRQEELKAHEEIKFHEHDAGSVAPRWGARTWTEVNTQVNASEMSLKASRMKQSGA